MALADKEITYDDAPPALLRCPFCGGEAHVFEEEYYPDYCGARPEITYGVGCNTTDCICEAEMLSADYIKLEDAIDKWNTRGGKHELHKEA